MLKLGTLIKYELKSVGRILLPLYGAVIIISALAMLFIYISSESDMFQSITIYFAPVICFLTLAAIPLVTIVMLIQRYYKNLLGNEGYLSLALPVSVNAHIAAKSISAGLWIMMGTVLGILVLLFMMVTPAELKGELISLLSEIVPGAGLLKLIIFLVEVVILAFMSFAELALKIYAAIAAGQIWSKHRVLGAVCAYIVFALCETILALIIEKFAPADWVIAGALDGFMGSQLGILTIAVMVGILIAIYWIINNHFLTKRLNLQ